MAETILDELRARQEKISLCAKLSQFAYASATPSLKVSVDDNEACEKLFNFLKHDLHRQPLSVGTWTNGRWGHFARFASHSWWRSRTNQFKWFRSQSYFYEYFDRKDDVNRIVLAFRGTWNDGEGSTGWYKKTDPKATPWARYGPPRWYNLFYRRIFPSNIGLSDFYYDAIIIRIPYTDGTVWKWYAYWGALVLGRTQPWLLTWLLHPARVSAANWISCPDHDRIAMSNSPARDIPAAALSPTASLTSSSILPANYPKDHGDVHLGFWSLWAAPEGFAGYDRSGDLPMDDPRLLLLVQQALENGHEETRTEILIVGHSLGGAASCFAALDVARKLEEWKQRDPRWKSEDVAIFHATFGAPPVGDPDFQRYFNKHFNQKPGGHESWSIYHERDLVASCFQFCGTLPLFKYLGWWGDWRGVGHRIRLTRLVESVSDDRGRWKRVWDGVKYYSTIVAGYFITIDILVIMYISSWIITLTAAFFYGPWHFLTHWEWPRRVTTPRAAWGPDRRPRDPRPTAPLDTEYHSLQRYIEFMEEARFETDTQVMRWDDSEGEVPT